MPRGGSRGGGRPKLPPELKRVDVTLTLNPILVATLKAIAVKRCLTLSALAEEILINYGINQ